MAYGHIKILREKLDLCILTSQLHHLGEEEKQPSIRLLTLTPFHHENASNLPLLQQMHILNMDLFFPARTTIRGLTEHFICYNGMMHNIASEHRTHFTTKGVWQLAYLCDYSMV